MASLIQRAKNLIGWDFQTPQITPTEKERKAYIMPIAFQRVRKDVIDRKDAITLAERQILPFRYLLQQMYLNTRENAHIKACVDRRKDLTLLRKWEFRNADGSINDLVTSYFCEEVGGKTMNKKWFNNFLSFAMDAQFYGYSLIWLGDVENSEFNDVEVVMRQNVSPERKVISQIPQAPNGTNFETDEQYKDYYILIETPNETGFQKCGWGLYWELSLYEIFARNLLGFNADYIEVNIAPFRQMKTTKTDENERAEAEAILRDMGTSGYAVTDLMDEIIFHPSGSGTGYHAYDMMEKRLHAGISKIVLGHEDAISSIPGKLGNSGEESPAWQAMEDKQTKDGAFILPIVNGQLFDKMRALGFNIPDGVTACMLNDNEAIENNNKWANLAVLIKNAGHMIDSKFFTEQTGIPLAEVVTPAVGAKTFPANIQNKLAKIYEHKHKH